MINLQSSAAAVKSHPQTAPPPQLSFPEGYVYRAVWFSRFNAGRFPNSATFNAGQLLMKVNGFRDADGRRPVGQQHLRETVSTLRDKGYLVFRSSRRRRQPTGQAFRRATYVECLVPIEAIRYLHRGRECRQTHRLPRIQKPAFTATPQKTRVHGHEVTKAPLEVTRKKKERASSNVVAEFKAEAAVQVPALVSSGSRDQQPKPGQRQNHHDGESLEAIEAKLDQQADELGALPTDPKPGRRWEIRDALARGHTTGELMELVAVAVTDRWAIKHDFWGDVVAHAVKHSKKYQVKSRGTPTAFGQGGDVLSEWLVYREAMIGTRPEQDTDTDQEEDQEQHVEQSVEHGGKHRLDGSRSEPPNPTLGEMLRAQPLNRGGQPMQRKSTGSKKEPVETPTLAELEISKKLEGRKSEEIKSSNPTLDSTDRQQDQEVEQGVEEIQPVISFAEFRRRHPELK